MVVMVMPQGTTWNGTPASARMRAATSANEIMMKKNGAATRSDIPETQHHPSRKARHPMSPTPPSAAATGLSSGMRRAPAEGGAKRRRQVLARQPQQRQRHGDEPARRLLLHVGEVRGAEAQVEPHVLHQLHRHEREPHRKADVERHQVGEPDHLGQMKQVDGPQPFPPADQEGAQVGVEARAWARRG